jgi:hypothetical protein
LKYIAVDNLLIGVIHFILSLGQSNGYHIQANTASLLVVTRVRSDNKKAADEIPGLCYEQNIKAIVCLGQANLVRIRLTTDPIHYLHRAQRFMKRAIYKFVSEIQIAYWAFFSLEKKSMLLNIY